MYAAIREHEICAGHRVVDQGGKCEHLHGHGYVITFTCAPAVDLNPVGMVVDFSVIKSVLCQWLEDNWDHRMLLWDKDPLYLYVKDIDTTTVGVPFNPTAENMAEYLHNLGNELMLIHGVRVTSVKVQETRKCSATYGKDW